jgi:hypothetical protein
MQYAAEARRSSRVQLTSNSAVSCDILPRAVCSVILRHLEHRFWTDLGGHLCFVFRGILLHRRQLHPAMSRRLLLPAGQQYLYTVSAGVLL